LGHDPWHDKDLSGGQRWWDQILRSIRECDAFVFALSAAAIDSRACLSEYRYAVDLNKPILPILVEGHVPDSLMPPALSELQQLNARPAEGHRPADLHALVSRFRQRKDVLVRIDRELTEFEQRLTAAMGTPGASSPPPRQSEPVAPPERGPAPAPERVTPAPA